MLQVDRSDLYKEDFNKERCLARNFTPHGAAATTIGKDGLRHFLVWQGYQLHGDIGERLGLKRKMDRKEWQALMKVHHPNAELKDIKGKGIWYCCPGQLCPPNYRMPEGWDVLGQLPPDLPPPNKKAKINFGTSSSAPEYERSRPSLFGPRPGIADNGNADNSTSTPQVPQVPPTFCMLPVYHNTGGMSQYGISSQQNGGRPASTRPGLHKVIYATRGPWCPCQRRKTSTEDRVMGASYTMSQ